MPKILETYGHLLAFLAVAILALVAFKLGAPPEVTGPIVAVLGMVIVQLAKHSEPPKGGAAGGLFAGTAMVFLVLAFPGCSPREQAALKTANDFREGLCDRLGEQEAQRLGVSWADVRQAWLESCKYRLGEAEREALGSFGASGKGGAP